MSPILFSFSRTGWLVELVPRIEGEGEAHEERKLRFPARLYRGVPAYPADVSRIDRVVGDLNRVLDRGAVTQANTLTRILPDDSGDLANRIKAE